jgi:5'-3' exonuclease
VATLYLVDGSFELFRCFYGAPQAESTDGRQVGAVRGLFQTLASLLREPGLTHVAVAFDNLMALRVRDGSDTELVRSQYDLALETVRALGMSLWPMNSRFQADDALATAAARYADDPALEQVVICSADADFAQCVRGNRVVVLNRITKTLLSETDVVSRYGVIPERIPEYLALVGDRSDGVPGIPGFGPKAAATLINRYGKLENVPVDEEAPWDVGIRGVTRLIATFRARRLEALLYRNLSIRGLGVPLPHSLEDLRWMGASQQLVADLAESLEDPALLARTIRYRES